MFRRHRHRTLFFYLVLQLERGIVHGHSMCAVNVYLKAHLLAVILRLELDFGAMCIVHTHTHTPSPLQHNSIPRMIFFYSVRLLSFLFSVHVIIIFRLLLLCYLCSFDASGVFQKRN